MFRPNKNQIFQEFLSKNDILFWKSVENNIEIPERTCFIPGSDKKMLQEENFNLDFNIMFTRHSLFESVAYTYNLDTIYLLIKDFKEDLEKLEKKTYGQNVNDIKEYYEDIETENNLNDRITILECLYDRKIRNILNAANKHSEIKITL